ncbi:MAG: HDIG domain-containing protein, partial [Planctomycetota bacterium]|nr:HDIG domain-containing protein [Planctomycetota bacterium]
ADVRNAVAPVTVVHEKDTTLVEAGKEITDADLRLLEQEQEARLAELGWARRALAWVGAAVIIGLLVLLLAVCALRLQPNLGRSFPRSLILAILCVLVLGVAKAVAQSHGPPEFYTFLLATAGMTVTVAYTRVFALALVWTLVFLAAIATRADLDWTITATAGTSVAILALDEINNRLKLIKVGALAGAAFFAARVALAFWRLDYADGNMLRDLLVPALLYFAVGVMTGVVMLAILPFIERAFGITTNISLLELCDVNQPALRRLALEAPGTYTHSLLIGSLAEAAAGAIGARGLLARVGAYFHDIGKALRPRSFGENWPPGEPPREAPTPPTGHEIILAHVKDGLDMADRLGLPPVIRQFIAEHHGTCLLEYFYSEARRLAAQAHADPPPEASYRYPGPKPRSRETAIVMLADAAEAMTRSLKERTAPKVSAAVHEIVMKRLLDGQLDSSGLTLADLHTVEETLTKTLLSVYHGRAVYPADRRAAENPEGRPTRDAGPAVGS